MRRGRPRRLRFSSLYPGVHSPSRGHDPAERDDVRISHMHSSSARTRRAKRDELCESPRLDAGRLRNRPRSRLVCTLPSDPDRKKRPGAQGSPRPIAMVSSLPSESLRWVCQPAGSMLPAARSSAQTFSASRSSWASSIPRVTQPFLRGGLVRLRPIHHQPSARREVFQPSRRVSDCSSIEPDVVSRFRSFGRAAGSRPMTRSRHGGHVVAGDLA